MMKDIKKFLRTFPRKHHVEYITALLSVPVLISVIALNFINLQNNNKKNEPSPQTANQKPIIIEVSGNEEKAPIPTDSPVCKKEVGPIDIPSPKENETVDGNPVCVIIDYPNQDYCSVVWSYRINNGNWSEYNSNSPCLYNLPPGEVKFELRVQSTASQDEEQLERNFIYEPEGPTPTVPASN